MGIVSPLLQRGETSVQTRQVFCNYLDLFTMHSSYHTDLYVGMFLPTRHISTYRSIVIKKSNNINIKKQLVATDDVRSLWRHKNDVMYEQLQSSMSNWSSSSLVIGDESPFVELVSSFSSLMAVISLLGPLSGVVTPGMSGRLLGGVFDMGEARHFNRNLRS